MLILYLEVNLWNVLRVLLVQLAGVQVAGVERKMVMHVWPQAKELLWSGPVICLLHAFSTCLLMLSTCVFMLFYLWSSVFVSLSIQVKIILKKGVIVELGLSVLVGGRVAAAAEEAARGDGGFIFYSFIFPHRRKHAGQSIFNSCFVRR
jgi:hypothetical protein